MGTRHPMVSGNKPSPRFWFTTSDVIFVQPIKTRIKGVEKEISRYLDKPEIVFNKIWATPLHYEQPAFLSLVD
jgi:hypothetical protein